MMVQQNKWRATRYGAGARLVHSDNYQPYSVQETTDKLIELLLPVAKELGCIDELQAVTELPGNTGAEQQLMIFAETDSRYEVVHRMLEMNDWRTE